MAVSYTVNPRAWGAVFPVPSDIVDKHIKIAGATQLKVLLWLLRYASQSPDSEDISKGLNLDRAEVEDALQYWIDAGIIVSDFAQETEKAYKPQNDMKEQKPSLPKSKATTYIKPNVKQIIERTNEDPEIKFMFSEVQTMMSKTIGHDGQSTLLMLHDSFGLPVEVILMLVKYCVSINKASFVYISKVGRDWGEREIDTIEKADEQISRLLTCSAAWNELRKLAGISTPQPTNAQMKYLESWENELGFGIEMIYLAYEEMANNCTRISFPYIDKVLKNWARDGIKTPDDVEKSKNNRKNISARKQKTPPPSYDLDEFMQRALNDPLIYEKKEED